MEEVLKYLKECGTFYLATIEGDQPRVRPFGAVCAFEGKLYIITNNKKPVYQQMLKNPKIEISGMSKMYSVDDNKMEVLYLQNVKATVNTLTGECSVIEF